MLLSSVVHFVRRWTLTRIRAPHVHEGLILSLPLWLLCVRYADYLPLWDGAIYFGCVIDGAKQSITPLAYNCAGHPSALYLWLPGVLTRIGGISYTAIIGYNVLLGALALMALSDLAQRVLPGSSRRLERILMVGAFAYCPIFTSSILQLTPDYGVLVFTVLLSQALVRKNWWRALLWGVGAAFSKESGILLFGLTLSAYVITHVTRAPGSIADRLKVARRCAPILVLPALGLVGGAGLWLTKGIRSHWAGDSAMPLIRQFLSVSFLDDVFPASLATIFELNFMWVPTLAILAYLLGQLLRTVFSAGRPRDRSPLWEFVLLLFLIDVYFLTRFRTFVNVRYYLPIFPWLFLVAARGLSEIGCWRRVRIGFWGTTMALMLLGNWTSWDAWSARRFGTYSFGSSQMYKMTSITGECCGHGRDQAVYNLQFAELHYLLNQALPYALGDSSHVLGINSAADWVIIDHVDSKTYQRRLPGPGAFKPGYVTLHQVRSLGRKPPFVNYVVMANMKESEELLGWSQWYDVVSQKVFTHNGYEMSVLELRLR